MRRALLLFVDGLGLGSQDPAVNPVVSGVCPHLRRVLDEFTVPVNATLGVPGLPQSATGQTALLTGVNAAAALGRHVEGFPCSRLRQLIRAHNVFRQLGDRGLDATFANAYFVSDVREVRAARLKSVTTVATLSALGTVRTRDEMVAGRAVYQDLTRERLRERGYDGPLLDPREAARHLLNIAAEHRLTLFEYFQTDRIGHLADADSARSILAQYDLFLGEALALAARRGILLLLTSDHGNIEDVRTRTHTPHPVPFAAVGDGADRLRSRVRSLTDVTPTLVSWLAEEEEMKEGRRRGI